MNCQLQLVHRLRPGNDVTLVVWTDLTLSPESKTTANAMLLTVLDEICTDLNP